MRPNRTAATLAFRRPAHLLAGDLVFIYIATCCWWSRRKLGDTKYMDDGCNNAANSTYQCQETEELKYNTVLLTDHDLVAEKDRCPLSGWILCKVLTGR
jgi:hypothetical protein